MARNAAGYLVASIRADYQDPCGWTAKTTKAAATEAERRSQAERRDQAQRKAKKAGVEASREAELKAQWTALSNAQRETIIAKVKAENPALKRWKAMLDPLCLAELERLLATGEPIPSSVAQATLFGEEASEAQALADSIGLRRVCRPGNSATLGAENWRSTLQHAGLRLVSVRSLPFGGGVRVGVVSAGAAVAGVVQDHGGDDRAQEFVDDFGAVLADVDGVEPELAVEVVFDGEHALHAARLAGFTPAGSGSAVAAAGATGRGGVGIVVGRLVGVGTPDDARPPMAWRRSNSASVMVGRTSPVRLSGPGIPPRRVLILGQALFPARGPGGPALGHLRVSTGDSPDIGGGPLPCRAAAQEGFGGFAVGDGAGAG